METKVFIWVLCACLVTLLVHKTTAKEDPPRIKRFTFLSYSPSQQGPVNGSNSENMTNHTNTTQESTLEITTVQNLAEQNNGKQNLT